MNMQLETPILSPSSSRLSSRSERIAIGKNLRSEVPRSSHASWQPPDNRRDPIDILEESNQGRLSELTPIRYGRMLRSPFTFLRGSAALMAYDLASTPSTKIQVQACGDCHLLNFGLFATPERNLVFDINDFDETHPAPWEWDLKRLAVSFVIAGRDNQLSDLDCQDLAIECVRSYREHLREYSEMSPLEVWYNRLDIEKVIEMSPDEQTRKRREKCAEKARQRVIEHLFPKITSPVGGQYRFADQPPLLYHIHEEDWKERVEEALAEYRQSLSDERKVLFDRYQWQDIAIKVVGIGSIGTRCFIVLFFSPENHPLILQFKEARPSVLEPYTDKSKYDNHGQRVVIGQRLMQSSSDIFLGWTRSRRGYDFYVRQLRDMKFSFPLEQIPAIQLKRYAGFCGWTLARAHAKSGDSAMISGYLGKGNQFDRAMGDFALAYADQTERDHAALVKAVKMGRIEAAIKEDL
ncbi:DUF2252 domain-containing protein [Gloeothece verrucosa]|uniref:DUF2252 domain-containing protein n=1 Tax=Gloeothece verrucosa (strain PCC 7822) TaxID=497965 RepID=E0U769_GLOV7|nr:DUF2252 domain-containing protein [Gloeothece verrucosa]ADN17225.1 Protein of unknown function DUF2252 [Gloeothece verrucosa PCC 7822]